jgi:hypothetical protein
MRVYLRYKAAIEAQKAREKLVREAEPHAKAENQRLKTAIRVDQARAARIWQDDHRRRDRD